MKPEPLKGKCNIKDMYLCKIDHVQSAVEWLKQEIQKEDWNSASLFKVKLYDLINEAFEDVTKKE